MEKFGKKVTILEVLSLINNGTLPAGTCITCNSCLDMLVKKDDFGLSLVWAKDETFVSSRYIQDALECNYVFFIPYKFLINDEKYYEFKDIEEISLNANKDIISFGEVKEENYISTSKKDRDVYIPIINQLIKNQKILLGRIERNNDN